MSIVPVSSQTDGAIECEAQMQHLDGTPTTQVGDQEGDTELVITMKNVTPYNLVYFGLAANPVSQSVKFPSGAVWIETNVGIPLVPTLNYRNRFPLIRRESIWNAQSYRQDLHEVVNIEIQYSTQSPIQHGGAQGRVDIPYANLISLSFGHPIYV
ncbi:MAG: hypothetical protein ETSY2_44135 [Candidatus Entotheonella gemina]|uniref:Uncharacterized protein n=1 Tax=Candidatus Entotheonella gemina TaxID=1429439 RepID=W4LI96_9BACT|nr:MAG: hypothetical protein ETSY2_44135 [Candidatus Entotheonella gemina]